VSSIRYRARGIIAGYSDARYKAYSTSTRTFLCNLLSLRYPIVYYRVPALLSMSGCLWA